MLAGEAVLDAWPGGVTLACRQAVIEALLKTMLDDKHVKPAVRAQAGCVLGTLGDPLPVWESLAACPTLSGVMCREASFGWVQMTSPTTSSQPTSYICQASTSESIR